MAEWDEEAAGEPLAQELTLRWLYGLLCLLEKPLLADTAADLNSLLSRLRLVSARPNIAPMAFLCEAIITEHFD